MEDMTYARGREIQDADSHTTPNTLTETKLPLRI
jgi:hypothetical protein